MINVDGSLEVNLGAADGNGDKTCGFDFDSGEMHLLESEVSDGGVMGEVGLIIKSR